MGCDINMIGEYKNIFNKWIAFPLPIKFTRRNYDFFALIRNVRNENNIKPLPYNIELPDDMSIEGLKWENNELDENHILYKEPDFDDCHSFGHIYLKDIKNNKKLYEHMIINLILITMWSVNLFDIQLIMTGGGPLFSSTTASLYMYRQAFEFGLLSKGAAAGIILILINLTVAIVYVKFLRK